MAFPTMASPVDQALAMIDILPGSTLWRFQRFLGVGAIGFVVDAAVFFGASRLLLLHYAQARLLASLIALTVTWLLNRRFTFDRGVSATKPAEYLRYLGASALGAAANLGAFALVQPYDGHLAHLPAYIIGTAAGLIVNFALYDRLVFRHQAAKGRDKEASTGRS